MGLIHANLGAKAQGIHNVERPSGMLTPSLSPAIDDWLLYANSIKLTLEPFNVISFLSLFKLVLF